jgi:hypothetical protein
MIGLQRDDRSGLSSADMSASVTRVAEAIWVLRSALAVAVLSVGACATRQQPVSGGLDELHVQYQRAIQDAAVRHPDWNIALWSFGDSRTVLVSTFTDDPALDTVTQHNWVAPTAQVRSSCGGQSDTVLFLERLLGLPPQDKPGVGKRWHVYTFEVSQDAIFRPCPGGVDSSVPGEPRCIAGSALDPKLDPDTAQFLLKQFWFSHRTAISNDGVWDFGYPWTAMGWTYNWDPKSKNHIGVSEFVVQKGAVVSDVRDATPAEFCSARPF